MRIGAAGPPLQQLCCECLLSDGRSEPLKMILAKGSRDELRLAWVGMSGAPPVPRLGFAYRKTKKAGHCTEAQVPKLGQLSTPNNTATNGRPMMLGIELDCEQTMNLPRDWTNR